MSYNDALFDYSTTPKTILNFDQIFKKIKILGSGEHGTTWLIRNHNNEPFALKYNDMPSIDEDETESLKHFSNSCHPSLICYIDHFLLDNKQVILTDYIDGKTLNATYHFNHETT